MVFHMLRKQIGDTAFWGGLQSIARDGSGKKYSWSDLQRHFQDASGLDLGKFFAQWIERPGAPRLTLADVAVVKTASGWQVSGILGQVGPVYQLAVPLRVVTEEGISERVISLAGRRERFVMTVAEQPVSLTVDHDSRLFRLLEPSELPATVNDLRASQRPLVVIASGSEALVEASADLLRGLQWHQADVIDESTYLASTWPGRDALFLGWPQSDTLRPELPPGIDGAEQQFLLDGQPVGERRDVLFMVRKEDGEDRVVAYFLPGSAAAARDTARRIPHYGRYSYLLFRDGRNQVKATWDPEESILQVHFPEDSRE
jgi:hypothetical protein